MKDTFELVVAKYNKSLMGEKPKDQQNIVRLLVHPGKGPKGRESLFGVLSAKIRQLLNFTQDPKKKYETLKNVLLFNDEDHPIFGPQLLYYHTFILQPDQLAEMFEPVETQSWRDVGGGDIQNGLATIRDLQSKRNIANLIRLAGHKRDFEVFIEKVFRGERNFPTWQGKKYTAYLIDQNDPQLMEKFNVDVIKAAIAKVNQTQRSLSRQPLREQDANPKRPAEEVEYELPNQPIAEPPRDSRKKPMVEPKKNTSAIWLIGGGIVLVMAFIRS